MASNLKLGSNWKACGYLYDMRRWSHSNTRVRKSMRMFPLERLLDWPTGVLGDTIHIVNLSNQNGNSWQNSPSPSDWLWFLQGWWQLWRGQKEGAGRLPQESWQNLQPGSLQDAGASKVFGPSIDMYWQDTENLRSRLRERRRNEERSKAAQIEEREKAFEGRLERNRRWRQRKGAPPPSSSSASSSSSSSFKELEDIQEERRGEPSERRPDEKEARKEKNREWRKKRTQGEEDSEEKMADIKGPGLGELLHEVLACSCNKVSHIVFFWHHGCFHLL